MKTTLHLLVGIVASGKSTLAATLEDENTILLSSDTIREELFHDVNNQDNNKFVFETMENRANELLKSGKSVIYDATNINRKRRIHLINNVLKADENIVYYMNSTLEQCKFHNMFRDRVVPFPVIDQMYRSMHIPVKNEGWDEVVYINQKENSLRSEICSDAREHIAKIMLEYDISHDKLFSGLSDYFREFDDIFNLPQDSSYHSFSVSRHTYHVYKDIDLSTYDLNGMLVMLFVSLFHDIGKAHCKSFINYKGEETRYASFLGHEFVSSQIAAYQLNKFGYDQKFIEDVVTLIQFHMLPMKAGEKKMRQVKRLIGDSLYEKLLVFHEADKNAK